MHEHIWQVLSRHTTSTGTVTYSRCHCGAHAVTLREDAEGLLALVKA